MPDPDTSDGGGILGLLGRMGNPAALYQGNLADPATQQAIAGRGLLSLAGGFADAAMPSRMPIPFGAALGHAAAAMGQGQDAVMAGRLQAAEAQQQLALSQLTQQKYNVIGGLLGLQQQWDQPDAGTPTFPGTIGNPTVSTVPHDAGPGWLAGFAIAPNTPTATLDPKLSGSDNLNNLAQTAIPIALPGYTVKMTSGERPGATVAGGGGESQHAKGNAADFQIYGPDGKPIPNEGPDSTGAYGKLALTMRMIAPENLKPWLGWGGNFSTGTTGPADLMHFDWAGDRGHRGTLAQLEQSWVAANAPPGGTPKPIQVASAGPVTGLLNAPAAGAGAQPPPGTPSTPPNLLQGPVPPSAMATGATVRGSWYGNSPGWSDPSDRGNQANGAPVSAGPGIALNIAKDSPNFGGWYDVTFPNGKTLRLQQTDVGPSEKGRGVDINSVAANQAGYTPGNFPTDQPISVRPATGGPQVAQAGPPQPLVTPPGSVAPAPPITTPQPQVAAVPSQATAAPGGIPGAPSPQRIALAHKVALAYSMAGLAIPPDVEATLKFGMAGPLAAAEAAGKFPYTWARPGGVLPAPGGGFTVAPTLQPGPPDAQGNPTQRYVYMGPNGAVSVPVPGASGLGPRGTAAETATGTAAATLGPTYPMGGAGPTAPPGTIPATTTPPAIPPQPTAAPTAETLPRVSPYGVIPPLSEQKLPTSAKEAESQIPQWSTQVTDWTKAIQPAQQAEQRLMTIARAFKSIQTGTWATEGADLTAALDAAGIHLDRNSVNDPAKVQLALHENILTTLPLLKAATPRPSQTEFIATSESREHPNIQPEANLNMLAEDIALVRQAQNLPAAYNISGWQNPMSFETAYLGRNKLAPLVEQVRQEIGPLKGMPGWVPPGLPTGAKPTGRTYQGKPVYEYPGPDGKPTTGTFQ